MFNKVALLTDKSCASKSQFKVDLPKFQNLIWKRQSGLEPFLGQKKLSCKDECEAFKSLNLCKACL